MNRKCSFTSTKNYQAPGKDLIHPEGTFLENSIILLVRVCIRIKIQDLNPKHCLFLDIFYILCLVEGQES
jgi:hypothetical protein